MIDESVFISRSVTNDDDKILVKMRNRDLDGLRGLIDRYMGYVSAVVWNILQNAMTTQDAVEGIFDGEGSVMERRISDI